MAIKNNIVATEQFVEEQLLNNQSDWSLSDSSQKNYVKNRTHYDDTESGGELKTLDEKYIPTTVPRTQTAKVGQIIVVKSVNESGVPVEWEAVNGQNNQDYLTLKDRTTGYEYMVYMDNGSLESSMKSAGIKVTKLPDKTDYTDSDDGLFDPTGMVVVSIGQDGTETEITNFEYDKYVTTESNAHEIRYIEGGFTHTVEIPITTRTLDVALQDFEYTTNEDGTYTITGWKQTLNGEPSTRMIVPNSELVIV